MVKCNSCVAMETLRVKLAHQCTVDTCALIISAAVFESIRNMAVECIPCIIGLC